MPKTNLLISLFVIAAAIVFVGCEDETVTADESEKQVDSFGKKVKEHFDNVAKGMKEGAEKVGAKMKEGFSKMWEGMKGFGKKLKAFGNDMTEGIKKHFAKDDHKVEEGVMTTMDEKVEEPAPEATPAPEPVAAER